MTPLHQLAKVFWLSTNMHMTCWWSQILPCYMYIRKCPRLNGTCVIRTRTKGLRGLRGMCMCNSITFLLTARMWAIDRVLHTTVDVHLQLYLARFLCNVQVSMYLPRCPFAWISMMACQPVPSIVYVATSRLRIFILVSWACTGSPVQSTFTVTYVIIVSLLSLPYLSYWSKSVPWKWPTEAKKHSQSCIWWTDYCSSTNGSSEVC